MALLSSRPAKTDTERDAAGSSPSTVPTGVATGKAQVDDRLAAQRRAEASAVTEPITTRPATTEPPPPLTRAPVAQSTVTQSPVAQPAVAEPAISPAPPTVAGPRPRASLLATMALILGLGGALAVLTGVLVGLGVALGLLATFASIGGIAATSRRHVAGKSDAMLGLLLGLGAIVVGTLALTDNLPWLDPATNQVTRLHDWLDARVPWLFPNS